MDTNENEYLKNIRFRPVAADADAIYRKVQHRIRYGKGKKNGVAAFWKYAAVAASVALLVVSSFLFRSEWQAEAVSYLEVTAAPGSKTRVVLPDSSVVWLNSLATVRYPQQFGEGNREVEFAGDALFRITPSARHPFIVKTDGLRVKVLGTFFYVSAPAGSDEIETTLLNGSVALYTGTAQKGNPDALLKPDEQARYNKADGSLSVQNVHAALYASWVKGDFVFENNTLQEITEALERAFNVPIRIESERLRTQAFTARFTHQESLDEILEVLGVPARYTYRKVKGKIYITAK